MEIRSVAQTDLVAWKKLYSGYLTFYDRKIEEDKIATLWSWLMDENHEVCGLVAEVDGEVQAFAHYRTFARPISAGTGLFLDDLFTNPNIRKSGLGSALLDKLREIAAAEGASLIRWITADDNETAKSLYDKEARATSWITYDMDPA